MRKNRTYASTVLLGIAVLAMTGCAKLPQEKIDAANQAVNEAQTSGAEIYAGSSYIALQDSLNSAMESIEAQKSKFFKSYDESVYKLDGVIAYAEDVKREVDLKKESLKTEILKTIYEIRTLLKENQNLISEAPKGKEGTSALVAIKGELDTIESTVTESESLMKQGDLFPSREKAIATKEMALSINNELKDVISKYKAARR